MILIFISACWITSACGSCLDGWAEYKSKCYKGFTADPKPWRAARDFCRSKSADLASIHSRKEQTFVVKMIKARSMSYTWIGLNDIADEGDFIWSDATSVDYLKWAFRQPNNFKSSQDCVSIIPAGKFRWGDFSCSNIFNYVCAYEKDVQNRKPTLQGGCRNGWTRYKDKCFKGFGHHRKSWRAARDSCRSRSADLASIHDAKEYKFLLKMINPGFFVFYWIGLNDITTEGDFVWSDGTPTDYTNWGKGQPNNFKSRQHCVGIIPAEKRRWGDFSCLQKFKYVCAYGLGPTNLTTTSSLQTSTTPTSPGLTYTTSAYKTETTLSTSTEPYCSWELECTARNRKRRNTETIDGMKKIRRNGGIYLVP